MEGNGFKSLVDTADARRNGWVEAVEEIGVFSATRGLETSIGVLKEGEGKYYIDYTPTEDFVAWFPCANMETTESADSVRIGDKAGTNAVYDDGKVRVEFPMVAFGNASSENLVFRHVTGALAFTLENNGSVDFPISKVQFEASKNGSPFGLWPDYWEGDGLVCRQDGNGNLVVESRVSNSIVSYNVTDAEDYGMQVLRPGQTVRVYFPIPVTENTDFKVTVKEGEDHGDGSWDDKVNGIQVTKYIRNITIQRNHILNLPKFQIQ